ncbi:hypothetical protein [Embleya sp. NPDC005971]|uniref:hypothetical protein n=1 Tax=unclassified Embleya TaxID=2699296 RepID=UPI0033C75D09
MDAEFRDGRYLLSVDPIELRTISSVLLLFPGSVTDQAFEDLVGITKEESEKFRSQLNLRTRSARREVMLAELEHAGRVDEFVAGLLPGPAGRSLPELRESLWSAARTHVKAVEFGTLEEDVLSEAGVGRIIAAISELPGGEALLRQAAEAEDAAVRFAVAGQWRELDRSTALRVLHDFELDNSRPLLGYPARMVAALLRGEDGQATKD